MRPFSPLYYIRENKSRCVLLMFMVFLSFGVYLGGLYVSNPMDNWQIYFSYYEKMTTITPHADDGDYADFQAYVEEIAKDGKVEVLELGNFSGFTWETVMGFEVGTTAHTFRSVEDFQRYCELMGITCDFSRLKSGSLILSERFARNLGLEIGDAVDKMSYYNIYDDYTLDALTAEQGYTQYFILEEPRTSPWFMLLANGLDSDAFYERVYEVQKQHKVSVYDTIEEDMGKQFETFDMLYMFVVILLSVILAVTINAAFVGMYQRRNLEFAVYRAMGIKKSRMIGKLVGELLWMDVIALIVGSAIFFLGLYLLNNLVLYPIGKYLEYFAPLSVFGILLCNAVVLVPLIITRCRQMLKADICNY